MVQTACSAHTAGVRPYQRTPSIHVSAGLRALLGSGGPARRAGNLLGKWKAISAFFQEVGGTCSRSMLQITATRIMEHRLCGS
jgi:hypothetical protein